MRRQSAPRGNVLDGSRIEGRQLEQVSCRELFYPHGELDQQLATSHVSRVPFVRNIHFPAAPARIPALLVRKLLVCEFARPVGRLFAIYFDVHLR
jgi:hypothetical protein